MLAEKRVVEVDLGGKTVKSAAIQRLNAIREVSGEIRTLLILLCVKEVDLDENTEENVNFWDDFLGFLLAVLGALGIARVNLHIGTRLAAQRHAFPTDSNEEALRNIARCNSSWEGLDDGLTNYVRSQALANEGDGSEGP